MAGKIIQIWRNNGGNVGLPVVFTVGEVPIMSHGAPGDDMPVVKKIDFRESGAVAGKRLDEPVFCITFEGALVERYIPASTLLEIAYEPKKADEIATPQLEE